MGIFSFTQDVAIDLGTANTIITYNGKIVVDEPSVVALDNSTKKMIAVGGHRFNPWLELHDTTKNQKKTPEFLVKKKKKSLVFSYYLHAFMTGM